MKKVLVLITAVAGILMGCGGQDGDMSSPPASTTTNTNTATSTNQ